MQRSLLQLALALLFANPVFADERGSVGPCLTYEPDVVMLQGVLQRHTFPGAPGYESVKAGDEPESGFYLHLARPVCTTSTGPGDDEESYLHYAQQNVRLVQLNFGVNAEAGYARLRPFLTHQVAIVGTLYAAHTGHHHAPLIVWVDVKASLEATRNLGSTGSPSRTQGP